MKKFISTFILIVIIIGLIIGLVYTGKNIVRNCIKEYLEDKTRILITHALQHVYYADRIYYMKKGKIVWEGDYRSLQKQEFFVSFQLKVNR